MNQDQGHLIDWLRRRAELLHEQKSELWSELAAAAKDVADGLFSRSMEVEIELSRITALKSHLETGSKPLAYDDAQIGQLFDSVHSQEGTLIERFEHWKKTDAAPLVPADFKPWVEAMAAYFRAVPGEA